MPRYSTSGTWKIIIFLGAAFSNLQSWIVDLILHRSQLWSSFISLTIERQSPSNITGSIKNCWASFKPMNIENLGFHLFWWTQVKILRFTSFESTRMIFDNCYCNIVKSCNTIYIYLSCSTRWGSPMLGMAPLKIFFCGMSRQKICCDQFCHIHQRSIAVVIIAYVNCSFFKY